MSGHRHQRDQQPVQEQLDDIIEQQLEHLHRAGPPVNLEGLPPEVIAEARPMLRIVELLVDMRPGPPLESDPVAMRLGLVPLPDP